MGINLCNGYVTGSPHEGANPVNTNSSWNTLFLSNILIIKYILPVWLGAGNLIRQEILCNGYVTENHFKGEILCNGYLTDKLV
jgi:hypothetical protein